MIGPLVVIAHEGGWDEILLVAAPILVIVGLLAVVKRRVDAGAPDAGPGQGADSNG